MRKESLVQRVTRQIGALRREKSVSQETLAEFLEIPVQHVSRIEGGQNITLATLERIAIALGLRVSVTFDPSTDGPRKPPPSRRQRTKSKRAKKS
ncbi:MAG: helix-turn-helix domain-containing protein [Polyangiaceae bacterium]